MLTHTPEEMQQLQLDLLNDTVADYNWITPNQYNDMHTTLSAGYKGLTGDAAKISGVDVQVTNSAGTSNTQRIRFP